MKKVTELFDLISGRPLDAEAGGPAHRVDLVLRAGLATVLFAAIYGFAVGSTEIGIAVSNLYKVPMVILLSTITAVPAALLAWKLGAAPNRAGDLLLGAASGNLSAALVLAALSPIVALYYHSSGWVGGVLAMVSAGLALVVGMRTLWRAVMSRAPEDAPRGAILLPLRILMITQCLALLQFIHIASPIIPEVTVFDGGVDRLLGL